MSGITIESGVTLESGITVNLGGPPAPTVPTANAWTFDPSYVGINLGLYATSNGSDMGVAAGNPETSLALGLLTGGVSLYDYAHKIMYSVLVTTEDPQDIPLNLAHIGFAYQYVDLNTALGDDSSGYGIGWCQNGEIHYAGSTAQSGLPTYGPGDYLDIATNLDTGKFWVRVNGGNWNGDPTADPATDTNGISLQLPGNGTTGSGSALYPAVNPGAQNYIDAMEIQIRTYSIPAGFTAI
jgi:hypothetical protein